MIINNQFSKENEERERSYIPPDYSEVSNKSSPEEEDEDDDEDIDLDDDDYYDEEEEDDDPAETEKNLEESGIEISPPEPKPINRYQTNMATPGWPSTNSWPNNNSQSSLPFGSNTGGGLSFGQKPNNSFGTGWGSGGSTSGGWGTTTPANQVQELDRTKKIIFCDVLDCIVCTLEGPQRLGLTPRDIWDIQLRLDVWFAMKRFSYLEKIYAMIPKTLIMNSSGRENWMKLLDYISSSLSTFLRIPTSSIQILTQSFISQSKVEIVQAISNNLPKEDIVYIGTQSGLPGQNSLDIDCATHLGIDYIDLQKFLTLYS